MATSGDYAYSVTALDIITTALEDIGALSFGDSIPGEQVPVALRKLNLIVKQWSGKVDFAPGLKMWTRKRIYVFLQKAQKEYSLGPSGDNATTSYATTTLSASVANGASSVTLTSATGISTGDNIGIELDSGSIHWTTATMSGSTATLGAVLTGAAASGNRVFAYTTKAMRPLDIETGLIRDVDGLDTPVDVALTLEDYQSIGEKGADGTPDGLYFEAQRTNATVFLNREPDDVTKVLVLSVLVPVQDLTETADDVDFPQEWFRALAAQLALDLCLPFGRSVPPELKLIRDEAVQMAQSAYPATTTLYFQPNADGVA